jgi:methylmalonyl-CoA mutase N-terminal domain/subunit
MGGAQSLHTNSMDEALWLPTEKSVRTALRTQQVLAYESGVADSVDPLAGSYLVEYLTDEIEKRATEYIQKIDDMGGALRAIENGYMQNEIEEAAYETQRSLEKREQTLVGVNAFQMKETLDLQAFPVDTTIERLQNARLAQLRCSRDTERVNELLGCLEQGARGSENLIPLFIECLENRITLGEICGVLRNVWGEYQAASWG